jgi:hypothetical protein
MSRAWCPVSVATRCEFRSAKSRRTKRCRWPPPFLVSGSFSWLGAAAAAQLSRRPGWPIPAPTAHQDMAGRGHRLDGPNQRVNFATGMGKKYG